MSKLSFQVIKQSDLETINIINDMKVDNMYCILSGNNRYSTICQYSRKYDEFHIVTVLTENLKKGLCMRNGDEID